MDSPSTPSSLPPTRAALHSRACPRTYHLHHTPYRPRGSPGAPAPNSPITGMARSRSAALAACTTAKGPKVLVLTRSTCCTCRWLGSTFNDLASRACLEHTQTAHAAHTCPRTTWLSSHDWLRGLLDIFLYLLCFHRQKPPGFPASVSKDQYHRPR